ncbi:ATP-binding protein [Longimicrobium terrae]|uniref:histidine kinase n=1 Tax=Longimicrobium terrae TaxID=1639882 RepID=A0A841H0N7_9BACT|nr:signal transduction histidine kinase/PAS domain-containing protein [Longimicrobium terrae]MBB6071580.1 signal transduction histidine kinase/PAS domain-containing protein [Longimicrobium terrae]NNC30001.1 GAF domain-containing protein [Longimicrobium terrae]
MTISRGTPDPQPAAQYDRARDGVCVLSTDWRVRYANVSLLEILDLLGGSPDADRFWDLLPGWENTAEAEHLRAAMDGTPATFRVGRERGGGFVWEVAAEPLGSGELRVRLRNVTAQVDAEELRARVARASEELAAREQRLDEIVAGAPVALALLDGASLAVLESNEAYSALLDPPWNAAGAVIGRGLEEFIPDFERSGLRALMEQVRRTGIPYTHPEYEYGGFQRGPAWFRLTLQPLAPDHAGLATHILLLVVEITDLVRARHDLESEWRALFEVLETLPVGVVVAQAPSGRTSYMNAAAVAIGGRPAEELAADGVAEYASRWRMVLQDGRPFRADDSPLARALRGEPSRDVEVVLEAEDGARRTLFVSGVPLRGASGAVERGMVTFYDVSERLGLERALVERTAEAEHAAAEAALRAEESRALRVMGRALVSSLDPENVLRLAAQSAMELLGARGAFVATPLAGTDRVRIAPGLGTWEAVDGAELPLAGTLTERALRDGTQVYNAGGQIPTSEAGRPIVDRAGVQSVLMVAMRAFGEPLGVLAVVNRTDGFREEDARLLEAFADSAALAVHNARRFAEERRRAEVNHALVNAAEALASTLDPAEVMERIARLAAELTDAEGAALTVLTGEARDEVLMPVATGLMEPVRGYGGKLEGSLTEEVTRDGQPRMMSAGEPGAHPALDFFQRIGVQHYALVPLRAGDEPVGVLGVVRSPRQPPFTAEDVGTLALLGNQAALAVRNARLYEGAQAASRAKSEFLAMMSHELRTPLNALEGYSSLLADGLYGPVTEAQSQVLARMHGVRRHLISLIDQVLDVARLEAGTKRVRLEMVALRPLVLEIVDALRGGTGARGLTLDAEAEKVPPTYTDPGLVRQILTNLIGNATKFTREGGIRVRLARVDDELRVEVEDTGQGIAPDLAERIFEPFYQVDPSTTRVEGGVGLGLALSREFARLLGGDLSVRSVQGEGSTFTLTLPVTTAPVPPASARQP